MCLAIIARFQHRDYQDRYVQRRRGLLKCVFLLLYITLYSSQFWLSKVLLRP